MYYKPFFTISDFNIEQNNITGINFSASVEQPRMQAAPTQQPQQPAPVHEYAGINPEDWRVICEEMQPPSPFLPTVCNI